MFNIRSRVFYRWMISCSGLTASDSLDLLLTFCVFWHLLKDLQLFSLDVCALRWAWWRVCLSVCVLHPQGCSVRLHPAGLHIAKRWCNGWTSQTRQSAGSTHEPDTEVWVKQPLWVIFLSWSRVTNLYLCPTVLRLGNSVEALEAAKRAIHLSDGVLRLCLTVSNLNRAMYFACDNVLWAGKTGIISQLDQHKWSQRSFRWLKPSFLFCVGFLKALHPYEYTWPLNTEYLLSPDRWDRIREDGQC